MGEICGDNRFEIIARAKAHLLDATNIKSSEDEMKVLDSFLFRCWQLGWLDKYDTPQTEEKDECTEEYEALGLKRLKELRRDTPQTEKADRIPYVPSVEMEIKRMVEERLRQVAWALYQTWKEADNSEADTPQTDSHIVGKHADSIIIDELQTDFVEDYKCFDCEDFFVCDEHQTDCAWK